LIDVFSARLIYTLYKISYMSDYTTIRFSKESMKLLNAVSKKGRTYEQTILDLIQKNGEGN